VNATFAHLGNIVTRRRTLTLDPKAEMPHRYR
jgi:hypothetical protein